MSRLRAAWQYFRRVAQAKRDGRWRYPPWACVGIYLLLTPAILLVEALIGGVVVIALEALFAPMPFVLLAMFTSLIVMAFVLAEVLYFALRVGVVDDGVPRCRTCGYNLTGNVSGRCPECGERISPDRRTVRGDSAC